MSLVGQLESMEPLKRVLLVLSVIVLLMVVQGADITPDRRISRSEAIDIARRLREERSAPANTRVRVDLSPPASLDASGPVYVVTFDEGDRKVSYFIEQMGGDVVGGEAGSP